jgi:hypothetical protein
MPVRVERPGRTPVRAARPVTGARFDPAGRDTSRDGARRPAALPVGAALLMLAAAPVGVLGGVALTLPAPPWQRYTGPWQWLHAGHVGYRPLAACLVVLALGYLTLAGLVAARRRWARTTLVTLTAVFDPLLVMVLLAEPARPGWLGLGAGVVLCSLAGLVLCYQPQVDLYLAEPVPGADPVPGAEPVPGRGR